MCSIRQNLDVAQAISRHLPIYKTISQIYFGISFERESFDFAGAAGAVVAAGAAGTAGAVASGAVVVVLESAALSITLPDAPGLCIAR